MNRGGEREPLDCRAELADHPAVPDHQLYGQRGEPAGLHGRGELPRARRREPRVEDRHDVLARIAFQARGRRAQRRRPRRAAAQAPVVEPPEPPEAAASWKAGGVDVCERLAAAWADPHAGRRCSGVVTELKRIHRWRPSSDRLRCRPHRI